MSRPPRTSRRSATNPRSLTAVLFTSERTSPFATTPSPAPVLRSLKSLSLVRSHQLLRPDQLRTGQRDHSKPNTMTSKAKGKASRSCQDIRARQWERQPLMSSPLVTNHQSASTSLGSKSRCLGVARRSALGGPWALGGGTIKRLRFAIVKEHAPPLGLDIQ